MIVTNKKLAEYAGWTLGQIVADVEFEKINAQYNAENAEKQERAYKAAIEAPENGKWVVAKNYTVNGRTLVRGTVIYVSRISGLGGYRIQHTRSRQTVFATDGMRNIMAHCTPCWK